MYSSKKKATYQNEYPIIFKKQYLSFKNWRKSFLREYLKIKLLELKIFHINLIQRSWLLHVGSWHSKVSIGMLSSETCMLLLSCLRLILLCIVDHIYLLCVSQGNVLYHPMS